MVFAGPGFAGGLLQMDVPEGGGLGAILNNVAAFMNNPEVQQQSQQLNQVLQQSFNDFMNQGNGT